MYNFPFSIKRLSKIGSIETGNEGLYKKMI
jgi:hypothetical protein